jgi:hypothetical protein
MAGAQDIEIGGDAKGSPFVSGRENTVQISYTTYAFYGAGERAPELIEKLKSGALKPADIPEAVPLPTLILELAFLDREHREWRVTVHRPSDNGEPETRNLPTPWQAEPSFAAALDGFWHLSRRALENEDEARQLDGHARLLGEAWSAR